MLIKEDPQTCVSISSQEVSTGKDRAGGLRYDDSKSCLLSSRNQWGFETKTNIPKDSTMNGSLNPVGVTHLCGQPLFTDLFSSSVLYRAGLKGVVNGGSGVEQVPDREEW